MRIQNRDPTPVLLNDPGWLGDTHQDRAVTASQARSHLFASQGQCLVIPPQRRCPFAADTSHEGHTVMFSPYVHKTPRSGSSLVTFSSRLSHLVFITDAATEAKTVPGRLTKALQSCWLPSLHLHRVSCMQAKNAGARVQLQMRYGPSSPMTTLHLFQPPNNEAGRKGQYLHVTAASVWLFSCKPGSFG